ncbi:MAG TPA: manganese efflux pump [Bacillota bacterium]|nr:manganese efflux pump [Bacillota bacterium]
MNILASLLFALSANMDNFVVGLSYGIKNLKIGLASNLVISLITFAGTALSMSLSKVISRSMPTFVASLIGNIMLILIGGWTIAKPLIKGIQTDGILDNPEQVDKDKSLTIDVGESITLGVALTINNIGLGIGASIAGLNIVLTSVFTFILSILLLISGFKLGSKYLSSLFSKKATIISGLIIIILGLTGLMMDF